ncbi:unnamed protein product [Meloidogyne enterolobii]|uniref:Uncharacterized protein n=1 Tax=Meloidogyne enterolobii TaxID=390850 RepID=A0ACB0YTF2_MELEN
MEFFKNLNFPLRLVFSNRLICPNFFPVKHYTKHWRYKKPSMLCLLLRPYPIKRHFPSILCPIRELIISFHFPSHSIIFNSHSFHFPTKK